MVAELVASCSTPFPQFPPILLAQSLGHTAPSPSPCPGKDLSLCRQQPVEIWGQRAGQARKKERKQGPPHPAPPKTVPPSPNQQAPVWGLNAKGEQRVLSEKARGRDRVGEVGSQPLTTPSSFLVAAGAGRFSPTSVAPSPNSHTALYGHRVMG